MPVAHKVKRVTMAFFIHISSVYWYARSLCDSVGAKVGGVAIPEGTASTRVHLIV